MDTKKMFDFNKNHFLIVGANSKTGNALSQFLSYHKARFSLSDTKPSFINFPIKDNMNFSNKSTINLNPIFVYDSPTQTEEQLKEITHIILSPGVPRNLPFLQKAKELFIPIYSEITFTYKYLSNINKMPFIIGITGSNGKSTTSYLLFLMLKNGYKKGNSYLLGNFGTPFITQADNLESNDVVVLELSSYQLEDGEDYHINAATILNVSENHLDRYESFTHYQKAKEKIFINQTPNDFCIINTSIPNNSHFKSLTKARIIEVSNTYNKDALFSLNNKGICFKNDIFIEKSAIVLNQTHMLENMLTSCAFAYNMGVDLEIIKNTLTVFKGLEHRSELVVVKNNVTVINDSKATTPYAVKPNLIGVFKNIVLILGGKNKNLDFSTLSPFLKDVCYIVFYGYSGKEIQSEIEFSAENQTYIYEFHKAVHKAYEIAKSIAPSTLLLSPGCTSFDQFTSFEERGNVFKQLIYDIK